MKLENFRIKEVVDANGDSVFYIEKKGWFLWSECAYLGFYNRGDAIRKIKSLCDVECKYHTVE